jgi:hypothetical protein
MTYHPSRRIGVGLMPTMLRLPTPIVVKPPSAPPAAKPVAPVPPPIVVRPPTMVYPGPVVTIPAGPTASPIMNKVIQAQAPVTVPISTQPVAIAPVTTGTLPGSTVPAQYYQTASQAAAPSAPPPLGPADTGAPPDNTMLWLTVIGVVVGILALRD